MEWYEEKYGQNSLKDIKPLSAGILELLGHNKLEIFKKTSLYINHFSAEYVVLNTNESELILHRQHNRTCVKMIYNVFEYDGCLDYLPIYFTTVEIVFAEFINKYLCCVFRYAGKDSRIDIDYRYFKDHPLDMFVKLHATDYTITGDYIYWLIQGNEPRWMACFNPYPTSIITSDSIIYLSLMDISPCDGLIIPPQILFVEYSCESSDIDADNFIAAEFVNNLHVSWTNYGETRSLVVADAFYNYTFNGNLVKSARNKK